MQNPTDHTTDALMELRRLLADYGGWEAWTGVSGIIYARRTRSSPPAVFRGVTPQAVADQVMQWEEDHR